jgi:hypothetical protein
MVIIADGQTVRNLRSLFMQGTLPIASIQLYVSSLAFELDMKRKRSHDQGEVCFRCCLALSEPYSFSPSNAIHLVMQPLVI